ncbi:MAG: PadR family transcriptional regulator [Terriglobales bacterium]
MRPESRVELVPGTLDLMILRTLELQPLHGVAIAERIGQVTGGAFAVKPGSLFPALHRLEQDGWIKGKWLTSESGHRRKCYSLTRAGTKHLKNEKKTWGRVVLAIARVLGS